MRLTMRPALLVTLGALALLQSLPHQVSGEETAAAKSDGSSQTRPEENTADGTTTAAKTEEANADATTIEGEPKGDSTTKAPADDATTAKASSDEDTTTKASSDEDTTIKASSDEDTTTKASAKDTTTAKASADEDTTTKASSDEDTTTKASAKDTTTAKASADDATTAKASPDEDTTTKASAGDATTAKASAKDTTTAKPSADGATTAKATADDATTTKASSEDAGKASSDVTTTPSGGGETTAADVPPPAPTGGSVTLNLRYNLTFEDSYKQCNSSENKAKAKSLKDKLEPLIKAKISAVTELREGCLTKGSLNSTTDVHFNSTVSGGNKKALEDAMAIIAANGTVAGDPVSVADMTVQEHLCTNSPPAALEDGTRSWTGSKVLDTNALYVCNRGYTLKASNGAVRQNLTSTCTRVGDGFLFGSLASSVTCQADPTTTKAATTTTATTTAVTTTTAGPQSTVKKTPYEPSDHSTFTNSNFFLITIPAVAGMLAVLVCFLCAIRIDSILCKVCAEGKV